MYKNTKFVFAAILLFSTQANAMAVNLNLTNETNGSLGPSIQRETENIGITIDAYYYDDVTNEITSAVIVGIDGVVNKKHPAGIGVGKSATSINPPGIDNVGGDSNDHIYSEFIVFSFDTTINDIYIETEGLGPHGTNVEFWSGNNQLSNLSSISDLGEKQTFLETTPGFSPTNETISWFAISAQPEDDFNVFSIQSVQFSTDTVTTVPVPAAFWLFLTGIIGLARKKYIS